MRILHNQRQQHLVPRIVIKMAMATMHRGREEEEEEEMGEFMDVSFSRMTQAPS